MNPIAKAKRLQLLREIGRKHQEREALGIIPLTGREVEEEVKSLDTFREESRDKVSNAGINSDEG
jgi:hypothetical protein